MNRILLLLFAACLLSIAARAQGEDGPVAQRIQAMKVAFMTDRLRLSPEEAQQFWPVYNQYEAEEQALRRKYRPGRPLPDMSDREAEQFLNDYLEMEQKLLDLHRTYIQRFKAVIPPRKVALLKQAEDEFKRELLRQLQARRENRRNN